MSPNERAFPAERLRAFRLWLGLSHKDIGSVLGISTRSVQKYEVHGAPEWVRYALLGWAVLVHGSTPRATARYLGFPWEQFPLPEGSQPDAADLAHLRGPESTWPDDASDWVDGDEQEPDDDPDDALLDDAELEDDDALRRAAVGRPLAKADQGVQEPGDDDAS